MYGAIYGDLIASLYQYREYIKHCEEEMIKASNKHELIESDSFYTEDTILLIAVLDAVINKLSYEETIKKYVLDNANKPKRKDYFEYQFSPFTIKWAKGELQGNSVGNGAMVKVVPIPTIEDSIILVNNDVIECTTTSHNTNQAIKSSIYVSNFIFLARCGYSLEDILKTLNNFIGEEIKTDFKLSDLRKNMKFNYSCKDTLPICLYCIKETNNFDDAIRLCLSLGGDVTSNCAIVGALAESLYGISKIKKEQILKKLPDYYKKLMPI